MLELPPQLPVNLIADDIKRGARRSCSNCPIARAVLRAVAERCTGHAHPMDMVREMQTIHAVVYPPHVDILDGPLVIASYELPPEAVSFIDTFDWHGLTRSAANGDPEPPLKPFSFIVGRYINQASGSNAA